MIIKYASPIGQLISTQYLTNAFESGQLKSNMQEYYAQMNIDLTPNKDFGYYTVPDDQYTFLLLRIS